MQNPNFSSGPCSKRPAWSIDALKSAPVGRSHRSALGKERIVKAINDTRKILNIPADYLVGILPASDTGAFECAMWSLLGPKPVTVLVWESFSEGWATDVNKQLKLNPTIIKADYGKIPDLSQSGLEKRCGLRGQRHNQRRENSRLELDSRQPRRIISLRRHQLRFCQ